MFLLCFYYVFYYPEVYSPCPRVPKAAEVLEQVAEGANTIVLLFRSPRAGEPRSPAHLPRAAVELKQKPCRFMFGLNRGAKIDQTN